MTIFLDMDGVCVDFVGAYLRGIGSKLKTTDITDWDIPGLLGITYEKFWDDIESFGEKFWVDLEVYPYFGELYDTMKRDSEDDVIFLSSPGWSPNACSGKLKWLQERFGQKFDKWIFTTCKSEIGNDGDILIDDSERNCQFWRKRGRSAILFPQTWNSNRDRLGDPWWRYPWGNAQGSEFLFYEVS